MSSPFPPSARPRRHRRRPRRCRYPRPGRRRPRRQRGRRRRRPVQASVARAARRSSLPSRRPGCRCPYVVAADELIVAGPAVDRVVAAAPVEERSPRVRARRASTALRAADHLLTSAPTSSPSPLSVVRLPVRLTSIGADRSPSRPCRSLASRSSRPASPRPAATCVHAVVAGPPSMVSLPGVSSSRSLASPHSRTVIPFAAGEAVRPSPPRSSSSPSLPSGCVVARSARELGVRARASLDVIGTVVALQHVAPAPPVDSRRRRRLQRSSSAPSRRRDGRRRFHPSPRSRARLEMTAGTGCLRS